MVRIACVIDPTQQRINVQVPLAYFTSRAMSLNISATCSISWDKGHRVGSSFLQRWLKAVSHLTGGNFGGFIRSMSCENNQKMKCWTDFRNSIMTFITNIAFDALTIQMRFFFLLFVGRAIENKQINNAHATWQVNPNLHLQKLRDHSKWSKRSCQVLRTESL